MTPDPANRGARALAGAEAKLTAASPDAASSLLAMADLRPLDRGERARLQRLSAQVVVARERGSDAVRPLLQAAESLAAIDPGAARDTYLEAFTAATFGGRFGRAGEVADAARAVLASPGPTEPVDPVDALLRGLATVVVDGFRAGTPALRLALEALRCGDERDPAVNRWLWLGCRIASDLWDLPQWDELAQRGARVARDAGTLSILPLTASYLAGVHLHRGEFTAAEALMTEAPRRERRWGPPA